MLSMGSAMQQTMQTSASGRKTAASGVVIEPFRLVLFALFLLVLGVALGWFTHSYYAIRVRLLLNQVVVPGG